MAEVGVLVSHPGDKERRKDGIPKLLHGVGNVGSVEDVVIFVQVEHGD